MASVESSDLDTQSLTPTRDLGAMVAGLKPEDIPESARRWAKHCILDWIAVTVGGAREPLTNKLIEVALADGATGKARIIGRSETLIGSHARSPDGAAGSGADGVSR